MSNFHRREFLTGTAAFAAGVTAALTGTGLARAGDPSFMNNVPDPLLAGKELPTFKFALEKSKGKVIGNSFGKEATADFQGDCRGFHENRTWSYAETPLACHRG